MLHVGHGTRRLAVIALCLALSAPLTAFAAPLPSATQVLARRGDHSAVVATAQRLLISAGISVTGGADGVFGPGTTAAVMEFQRRRGLSPTGVIDLATGTLLGLVPPTTLFAAGAHSAAVTQLQRRLIAVGLVLRGGADGIFGPSTVAALKSFQTSKGLPPTGRLDVGTDAVLANAAGSGSTVQQTTRTPTLPAATPAPRAGAGSVHLDFFPITPTCSLVSSFGAPRSGGRHHEGMDIMAAKGTPIYAVKTGMIHRLQKATAGSLAGNSIWLTVSDGTYFFYAHLDHFAEGLATGSVVQAGTLIGYVGATGNAGTPHLHLEVHPGGGVAVDPYPIVRAASTCG